MLWVAAIYSSGIVAGVYAWRPATWWIVGFTVFLAGTAHFLWGARRSGVAWLLGSAAFFLAGALHIQLRSAAPRLDTGILPYADRREVQVTAHVVNEGRLQRGGPDELRQTIDLECEQVETHYGQTLPLRSGIRLSVYTRLESEVAPVDFPASSQSEPFTTASESAF
jgi:hypothetical protein